MGKLIGLPKKPFDILVRLSDFESHLNYHTVITAGDVRNSAINKTDYSLKRRIGIRLKCHCFFPAALCVSADTPYKQFALVTDSIIKAAAIYLHSICKVS